jgi:pyrroline-5-carboxylate reductase
MRIGFVGTGGIAEAIITGLLRNGECEHELLISRRSRRRSERLAKLSETIKVLDENQAIVDQVDWVVISVLPNQAVPVLESLCFRDQQTILSLVAGLSVSSLQSLVQPAENIHRLIPMPPIEKGLGPIPIHPPNPSVESFFGQIGTAIPVSDEQLFTTFSACSAVMASFFELVATLARWMESKGVDSRSAAAYAKSMIHALSSLALEANDTQLQELSVECLTKGGLNEQVLQECRDANWFDVIPAKLDRILMRLGH